MATTRNDGLQRIAEDAAASARNYVSRHWKYREPAAAASSGCCGGSGSLNLFDRILSHTLCVSGMAFQDAWNIDLERLQQCCVHVATPQNRLIPFCAYYMTDSRGRRLLDQRQSGH